MIILKEEMNITEYNSKNNLNSNMIILKVLKKRTCRSQKIYLNSNMIILKASLTSSLLVNFCIFKFQYDNT